MAVDGAAVVVLAVVDVEQLVCDHLERRACVVGVAAAAAAAERQGPS